jgi:hypothetical protein
MAKDYPTSEQIWNDSFFCDGIDSHVGIPSDSPGATGWTMALDKLAAYVGARIAR